MDDVKRALQACLVETSFDFDGTVAVSGGGYGRSRKQCVSAPELREFCVGKDGQAVEMRVSVHVPEKPKSRLVDALRTVLGVFIDPETDRIGHAFPVSGGDSACRTHRADGLVDMQFISSLQVFADALVQAAAIAGVEETAQSLADWANGKPVLLHECTVLNDVHLTAPVSPSEEIQLIPLGLRITEQGVEAPEFPRLPIGWNISLGDYFGLTLLKLSRSAAPALFHPVRETNGQVVPSVSVDGIALDRACGALSLLANWHVSPSVVWHDYSDAASFCLEIRDTWSYGGNRVRRMGQDNPVTITLEDDARFQDLDRDQLRRTLQALPDADKKLRITIDRWRRSVPGQPNLRLEDQCIDLRIALEMLFLKDFANARSQEMRFRLSVFGAWYLADDIEERRRIRKTLMAAYDAGSRAVHLGEVPEKKRGTLSTAQDLCRRAILKLLHEGPPDDWGDLILGAGIS